MVSPIATLLLAAGCSRRLGRPKQLVRWAGVTLLRRAAQTALAAELGPVIVVLGSEAVACAPELAGLPVSIVLNDLWPEGMGASIAAGMAALPEPLPGAVLIHLCDQPGVTAGDLQNLARHQSTTGASIVASSYAGTLGSPALFSAEHFSRLRELSGTVGAKSLFADHPGLATLACPGAALDIDTEEDLAALS